MKNIRRLYFYLVTFISLELIIWGSVTLVQTVLNAPFSGGANILASGLSLVLVGIPIFLLHGSVIQRDAARDPEERANRLRAIFFYGVLLTTLIPVAQGGLSALSRLLANLFQIRDFSSVIFGFNQPLTDHLAGMAVNGLAFIITLRLLRGEEKLAPENSSLGEVGLLYRYVWMLYTLVFGVYGVFSLLLYVLSVPGTGQFYYGAYVQLVNGLALTLIGAPLWYLAWGLIQNRQNLTGESRSQLRRLVLYTLTIVPAVGVVVSAVSAFGGLVRLALGNPTAFADYLSSYRGAISIGLPLAVIWAYFQRILRQAWQVEPDELHRAALIRLYRSLLSLLGFTAVFLGAWNLLNALVDTLSPGLVASAIIQNELSDGIVSLAAGLLLWLPNWRLLQAESDSADASGDHARRSLERRAYLYLIIFASVVGVMVNAGILLYNLFNAVFGSPIANLGVAVAHSLVNLALFGVWLFYHLRCLRQDGRQAQLALAARRAAYPVLVVSAGDPVFFQELGTAMQQVAPGLPVFLHPDPGQAPGVDPSPFQAVILPAGLAVLPGTALHTWLANFNGRRLVAPLPGESWVWLGVVPRPTRELARETALAVRQLAEGEAVRPSPPNNPWVVVGYVFGSLFAVELLLVVLAVVSSMVFR